MNHLFCFGYGYTAGFLARQLLQSGWKVSGTYNTTSRTERQVALFRYGNLELEHTLREASHVLISIPPSGDDVLSRYASALRSVRWIGYLSATSVYGDHGGRWVSETSPTHPTEDSGVARLRNENLWLGSGLPVCIFRLSAIYGPGRSVIEKLLDGATIPFRHARRFSSRMHVEDIANTLSASISNPRPGNVYNCADDLPTRYAEVITYAASLLGMESKLAPELSSICDTSPDLPPPERRVSNDKIKRELGVALHYPNYKIGLQSILHTHGR
ncbi:SDR family oxidoreductase [Anaplasma capra]|uniref:SDR family oxidoreductase n=1 Tax=Anaplasma capra TaxID=1562740 RepID=UPI0021D5EEE1|nr:SDR family oxidoreductase [Anaplasma capra]MCU7611730.1 SDR family oxidoreductase [Anaplasma capra]MCU7612519.1 SDR family oxidoreductase [Anaplasma capra]